MMLRSLGIGLFWVLAGALAASQALASGTPEGSRRIVVHRNASPSESAALDASLRELLSRLGATLVVAPGALRGGVDEGAFALVDISFSEDGKEARVVIVDGRSGKEVSRRTIATQADLRVEATAHIIQFAVEDLLTFERNNSDKERVIANPPPPPPSPPAPPPRSPTRDESTIGLDLGALFGVRSFGGGAGSTIGGGLELGATYGRGNWRPGVTLDGQIHAPLRSRGSLLEMSTEVLAFRAIPNMQVAGGRIWAIEAGIGGGVDVWITEPTSNDLPSATLASNTRVTPVVTTSVKGRLAVAKSADVVLTGMIDGDIAPTRYVLNDQGARQSFFYPNRVRPAVFIGFSFALFGPDPYPLRKERSE